MLETTIALVKLGLDVNAGDKRENVRPICSAASGGYYDVVQYLLNNGAELDVSVSVCNPLFSAIVDRSPDIVKLLLEAGIGSGVRYNSDTMNKLLLL
ncbi:MAG: ankyrin repeat domain-containing protein [Candidatus Thiodiazotropha sp. (ex Lucinoma borealis)]|nr:ankyrin repeat domain-containing protein [Candidatus Thiodiazotropha sp. (ex Lucinoma borealis)]MCU7866768.1 ankyrin repeat domain-containing protein [Candidatus Thiodiazotropha sp. (ex Lucinoma borealis)]